MRANQPEWEAIGIDGRYHWLGKLREPTWYPYTKARRGLIGRIAQAFNARDLRHRLDMRG